MSTEHLLVLGIVILLFGGRRLPELGASLGKGMRSFKAALEGPIDVSREGEPAGRDATPPQA